MNDWTLLQLADSAFPTGGFAHSGGLEATVQLGLCGGPGALERFLEEALWQCGAAGLPWVTEGHRDPERAGGLDRACDASIPNHVANRASRIQGESFLRAVVAAFPEQTSRIADTAKVERWPCHLAPVFGAVLGLLGATPDQARRLFLFQSARGIAAAAVRLGVVGPFEAQRLLTALAPTVDQVLESTGARGPEDAALTSPIVDLAQGHQDRLYSRLFQS